MNAQNAYLGSELDKIIYIDVLNEIEHPADYVCKLLKKPIWLFFQEKRQANSHASILIAVENVKQA